MLGAVMVDDSLFPIVTEILKRYDFFRVGHRRAFECQVGLHNDGRPLDMRLMVESLGRNGFLDEVGGPAQSRFAV